MSERAKKAEKTAMPKQADRRSKDKLPIMDVQQQACFEYWFNFGNFRRLQDVADHFGLKRAKVAKWKHNFNWLQMAEDRMVEVQQHNNKIMLKTIAEQRNQLTRILDMGLDAIEQAVKDQRMKFSSADMERLIKLRLLTLGENTESIKHEFSGMDDKDLIKEAEKILGNAMARGAKDGETANTD